MSSAPSANPIHRRKLAARIKSPQPAFHYSRDPGHRRRRQHGTPRLPLLHCRARLGQGLAQLDTSQCLCHFHPDEALSRRTGFHDLLGTSVTAGSPRNYSYVAPSVASRAELVLSAIGVCDSTICNADQDAMLRYIKKSWRARRPGPPAEPSRLVSSMLALQRWIVTWDYAGCPQLRDFMRPIPPTN